MLASWLQKATSALGRPEPVPQPFAVDCDCGATVQGVRVRLPQRPACPQCGSPVFVLPANVYPEPLSWSAPPAPPEEQAAPNKKPRDAGERKAKRKPTPPAPEVPKRTWAEYRLASYAAWKRFWTPLRIVGVGIVAVVLATTTVVWQQARLQSARQTVAGSIERGMAAFRDRDFLAAMRELRDARRALDLLGRKDAPALLARQLSREAEVAANMSVVGLPALLIELLGDRKDKGTSDAASAFRRQHRGNWIIFDAALVLVEPSDGSRRFHVDFPLFIGATEVQTELSDPPWKAFLTKAANGAQRVVFAAQMDEFLPASGGEPATLRLRGSTAVLWATAEGYEAVGLQPTFADPPQALTDLLAQQREYLGMTP